MLISRLGNRLTLVCGLLFVTMGSALRGVSFNATGLYVTTIVMAIGIAVMQPTMVAAARQWLPSRVTFATAVYSNGLLVGEILPVALALSVVMRLVDDSWRAELAAWALPTGIIAVLVAVFAPRAVQHARNRLGGFWWPNWKDALIWKLGLLIGTISAIYYATNAFLPEYLSRLGRGDLIQPALTAFNVAQLPASLVLLGIGSKIERQAWPYIVASLVITASIVGLVFIVGAWTVAWAAVLGFAEAAAMTLGLTLPALLAEQEAVGPTSAATFTLSYGMTLPVALISGAVWDISGIPALAFFPIALCGISLGISALLLKSTGQLH